MIQFRKDGRHLHLASTPRHIMSAFAIAAHFPEAKHQLIIFDQPKQQNDFVEVTQTYIEQSGLFESCQVLYKQKGSQKQKAQYRKKVFAKLEEVVAHSPPNMVYVGNDRRLEFQYLAQLLDGQSHNVYVDEGTGSYNNFFGISKFKNFFDKHVDTKIKKIVYGPWFDRPSVLGDSKWIHSSILCFPELANYALTKKPIKKFESEWIYHSSITTLLQQYAAKLALDISELTKIKTLFVLPHSSFIESDEFNITEHKEKVAKTKQTGQTVGFKYHPRQQGDPLDLNELGVIEIPRQLPLEIFLPMFSLEQAFGDISSALLSIKWINPKATVCAEKYNDSDAVKNLFNMFNKVGIETIEQ